jgi:DnaK suppressor protein
MPFPHRHTAGLVSTLLSRQETGMTTAVADHVDHAEARAVLEARRRRVIDDLRCRMARLRDDTVAAPADADADVVDTTDLDASLLEIATATLHHINRALKRLDNGQYGWCTRCHCRIAPPRLRAMPFAVRCRECETAREDEARVASSIRRHARARFEIDRAAGRGEW